MASLYLHIPFCKKKCIYCDFFSQGVRNTDFSLFTKALINEFERRKPADARFDTVYLGGGTPSLLPADALSLIAEKMIKDSGADEVTIEVNPDDIDKDSVLRWKDCGVNRVSMGVQSFDDAVLKFLGRRHNSEEAASAYRLLEEKFTNISIDLIFGIPGQTEGMWTKDIEKALSLNPAHISCYNLMYEEGTPITYMRDRGDFQEIGDEMSMKMYSILCERLKGAGYEHYEISNFCRPGHQSRHNSHYWDGSPYLGLGPGAHSYDGKTTRQSNRRNIKDYNEYYTGCGSRPPFDKETLTKTELMEELVLTRLRTRTGLSFSSLTELSANEGARVIKAAKREAQRQNIIIRDEHIIIPEEKWMMADSIILSLVKDI